jgi:anti-sigma B factor antagonist
MLDLAIGEHGQILLSGRLDTAQCAKAQTFLDNVDTLEVLDFAGLEYISSAGLGVLLIVQKRAMQGGSGLTIININNHIYDIFRFSGFDKIFKIQRSEA